MFQDPCSAGQHWEWFAPRGDDPLPFGSGPIVNATVIEEHMSGIDAWGMMEWDDEKKKVENQTRNVRSCLTITAAFLDALLPN